MTRVVAGIDGGGTRTRLALADADGRELVRRTGSAGLVDPRDPAACAGSLIGLVRDAAEAADATLPLHAVCAGLAGAGDLSLREQVRAGLRAAGVAERVDVVTDGETALEGALPGEAGVLLVAGTGSVAFARTADGRLERCGGWGAVVGDEGSGYAIARAGLRAALRAADGRGPETRLLPVLLAALDRTAPRDIPSRVARCAKDEVAALAPRVVELAAEGDAVAMAIRDRAADDLARHVTALLERHGPWTPPVPVVFHGGLLSASEVAGRVEARLTERAPVAVERREPAADAVTGAVQIALRL